MDTKMATLLHRKNIVSGENITNWHLNLRNHIQDFDHVINNPNGLSEKYLKLLKSLKYWNNAFLPVYDDNRLIFTLYDETVEVKLNIPKILKFIADTFGKDNIASLYFPRNGRYFGIDFVSVEMKELVESKFVRFDNSYVVPATWGGLSSRIDIRAHWLPVGHDLEKLKLELGKYVKVVKIYNEEFFVNNEMTFKSNVVNIKATPIEANLTDKIPHLIKLDRRTALITVKGRQPICLNCNSLGHKSAECVLRKCRQCFVYYEGEHINCSNLKGQAPYAALFKSNAHAELEIDVKEADFEESNKSKKIKLDTQHMPAGQSSIQHLKEFSQAWTDYAPIPDPNFQIWQEEALKAGNNEDSLNLTGLDQFMEVSTPDIVTPEEFYRGRDDYIKVLRRSNRKNNKETRLRKADIRGIWYRFLSDYNIIENRLNSASGGLAIAIKKGWTNYITKKENINDRAMAIHFNYEGYIFVVINVHAPIVYKEQKQFYSILRDSVSRFQEKVIILGDFNINNGVKEKLITSFMEKLNLADLAIQIGMESVFTRFDSNSANRLDRVLYTNNIGWNFCLSLFHVPFSDHLMLQCVCQLFGNEALKFFRRGLIPNLDTSVINAYYKSSDGLEINSSSFCNPLVFWELKKKDLYDYGVSDYIKKKKQIEIEITKNALRIDRLVTQPLQNEDEILLLKYRLEYLHMQVSKHLAFKLQSEIYETSALPRWKVISLLKKKKVSGSVHAFQVGESIYTNELSIVQAAQTEFINHINQKFDGKFGVENFNFLDHEPYNRFFKSKGIVKVQEEYGECLNKLITMQELELALAKVKVSSVPGPDGISYIYYKEMNKKDREAFLDYMNMILVTENRKQLLIAHNQAFIKMIPKVVERKGHVVGSQDYRPIALMNNDIKILQKILLQRISPVVDALLPPGVYGIKGRNIGKALLIYHLMFNCKRIKSRDKGSLVKLDMTSAFSYVNVEYLRHIMIKYLGNNRVVRLIIDLVEFKTIAFLNKNVYWKFQPLSNSLLQGSPLSSILYSFYLIELYLKLNRNNEGIWLNGRTVNIKLISYIDDLTIVVKNKATFARVYKIVEDFLLMTGSEINQSKSYLWDLNANKILISPILYGKHKKILGMVFPIKNRFSLECSVLNDTLEKTRQIMKNINRYCGGWFETVRCINSLIISMFVYYLPFVKLSRMFLTKFNRYTQNCLFKKFKTLAHGKTCFPRRNGGLGLIDLEVFNETVMYNFFSMNVINDNDLLKVLNCSEVVGDHLVRGWMDVFNRVSHNIQSNNKINYKKYYRMYLNRSLLFTHSPHANTDLSIISRMRIIGNFQNFVIKLKLGILPTKERLSKIGIFRGTDTFCQFGCGGVENIDHMFWQCTYARYLYDFFVQKINQKYDVKQFWITKSFKSVPFVLHKLLYGIFFGVWKIRCIMIFQNRVVDHLEYLLGSIHQLYKNDLFVLSEELMARLWDPYVMI